MNNFEKNRNELGLECSVLISDFYYLNNLDCYIKLIESFLNYQIDVQEFKRNFYQINRLDLDKDRKWKDMLYIIDNLELKQFQGLSSIISKLFTDLDVFEEDPLLREEYEIDEEELRDFAKDALSKLKNYSY
uniref:hypothetical protein n=1 Tax=Psammodictyon constrictum TaxID=515483 RepID=UPI001EF9D594|nr:hypothetical protein MKU01_pgp096 [Psammodictyon constrictum]ULD16397.1 hypothetical protein [Psammodictyon constrictum]